MQSMEIPVELEGLGIKNAKIGFLEMVAFEREYNLPSTAAFSRDGDTRIEWLFYMIHRALKRQKVPGIPSAFDDFLAIVIDIDPQDEDGENPTEVGTKPTEA